MQPLIPAAAPGLVLASAWTTGAMVLGWIAAGLGALVLLLLVIPIHVRAVGVVDDLHVAGRVRIRWAWGLISVHLRPKEGATLRVVGLKVWTFRGGGPKDEPEDEPKKNRAQGWLQWLRRHHQTILPLVKRLVRTLRLKIRLRGEVGLGDPAGTALVNRLVHEVSRAVPSVGLAVEPAWLEERIQLDGALQARIWLAHMGLVLVAGLAHRETRQMIRAVPRTGR